MQRVYNFSAGPSTLPVDVLDEAKEEMLNYKGSGMSVMEMSHRSSIYGQIHEQAKEDLMDLLGLDNSYDLLFLQGGGSTQFAMIPLNLLEKDQVASYLITGSWAEKAYKEAKKFAQVEILASSKEDLYTYIPEIKEDQMDPRSKYLYLCVNNTIYGTRINPEKIKGLKKALVADVSSNILSEGYDYTKFDLFFAGAQKNLGPAGVTLVGLKKDLITDNKATIPTMLDYKTHMDKGSIYNTPPAYSIYITGLVAKWIKKLGGLKEMEKRNKEKAQLLYEAIDASKLFENKVTKEDRSLMNVVFTTKNKDLDLEFVEKAKDFGLVNLKGHRSIGGMRASIYNAMPLEGVKALVDFMDRFEKENR